MRARLPEGFVDHVRHEALNTQSGDVLILSFSGEGYTLYRPEHFLSKVLLRLADLLGRGAMFNLTVIAGRTDKQTGQPLPPRLDVQEYS